MISEVGEAQTRQSRPRQAQPGCADLGLFLPGEDDPQRGEVLSLSDDVNEKKRGLSGLLKRPSITDWAMAAFTLVLTVVSYFQWREIHDGGKDTHKLAEATLAGSRAWVAPEQIVLLSPTESGLPLKYQIRLVNPGKEPAIGVAWNLRPFGIPYVPQENPFSYIGGNQTCSNLKPDPQRGVVLYPSGTTDVWLPLNIPDALENQLLLKAIQNKEQTLVIEGCFAYLTATQEHTSAFRYFLRDVPGPSFLTPKQGRPTPAWNFNMALDGNRAD
jgi:hypothetical protein